MSRKQLLRKAHRAFTLFELLVVIAIIGMLIAMLMPALNSAREAARRLQCTQNMRQLGLAITLYETKFGVYPPANTRSPKRHNLLTFVLPFLDLQPVYDQYDWDRHWNSPVNEEAIRVNVRTFRCPSAPGSGQYTTDYAACSKLVSPARRTLLEEGWVTERDSWLGLLQRSRTTTAMVTDGLSNSFMLFEDSGRPTKYEAGRRRQGKALGAAWADAHSAFEIHAVCRNGSLMNCRNDNEIYSFHRDGCNFLYGDGSVHFVTENVDPDAFVSLFTREARDIVRAVR